MADKPNCRNCKHIRNVPGDAHKSCANNHAHVKGDVGIGIRMGWFMWPWNFDPVWLVSCDGFAEREVSLNV